VARVLFLVSSARELQLADGTQHVTGYFAEEALTPYEKFEEAGVDIIVATPDGREPYADPYGLESFFHYPDEDEDFLASVTRTFAHDVDDIRLTLRHLTELSMAASRRVFLALREAGLDPSEARDRVTAAAKIAWRQDRNFLDVLLEEGLADPLGAAELKAAEAALVADSEAESARVAAKLAGLEAFKNPVDLSSMTDEQFASFDALFAPGGHGPMVDMADNPDVGRALAVLHAKQAPIASLCHGPALLLSAPANGEGQWLFDGFRLTSFTDEEEEQTPPGKLGMEWWLETALKQAGAVFDDSPAAWTSHVVVDRNLITAQNPQSADASAEAVLKYLSEQ